MPTFIDESGDTGSTARGGTARFLLAAVWIPQVEGVRQFSRQIASLRQVLGLPATFEFKFTKTHHRHELRDAFFALALDQDFRFAVGVVTKEDGEFGPHDREGQLWGCITEVAVALRPAYHRVEVAMSSPLKEMIVVDDNADRNYLSLIKRQSRA